MSDSRALQISYPAGVRHKDRAELEDLLRGLDVDDATFGKILAAVELALVAGARKVPSWIGR